MVSKLVIDLDKEKLILYEDLIRSLVDIEYERVPMVLNPGHFSVRGCIIDVFPVNQTHPLRFEYDDNSIYIDNIDDNIIYIYT